MLENRSLIADGRNETEEAVLCDLGTIKRGRNDSITTDHSIDYHAGYQKSAGQGLQTYRPAEPYIEVCPTVSQFYLCNSSVVVELSSTTPKRSSLTDVLTGYLADATLSHLRIYTTRISCDPARGLL